MAIAWDKPTPRAPWEATTAVVPADRKPAPSARCRDTFPTPHGSVGAPQFSKKYS